MRNVLASSNCFGGGFSNQTNCRNAKRRQLFDSGVERHPLIEILERLLGHEHQFAAAEMAKRWRSRAWSSRPGDFVRHPAVTSSHDRLSVATQFGELRQLVSWRRSRPRQVSIRHRHNGHAPKDRHGTDMLPIPPFLPKSDGQQ